MPTFGFLQPPSWLMGKTEEETHAFVSAWLWTQNGGKRDRREYENLRESKGLVPRDRVNWRKKEWKGRVAAVGWLPNLGNHVEGTRKMVSLQQQLTVFSLSPKLSPFSPHMFIFLNVQFYFFGIQIHVLINC